MVCGIKKRDDSEKRGMILKCILVESSRTVSVRSKQLYRPLVANPVSCPTTPRIGENDSSKNWSNFKNGEKCTKHGTAFVRIR